MDKAARKIVLEAVKTAIITELRGLEIYKAAAERTTDHAARLMFQSLPNDEAHHKQFLKNFHSLLESGEWSVPATPENLSPLDDSQVITPQFLKRVKGGAFGWPWSLQAANWRCRRSTSTPRRRTNVPTKSPRPSSASWRIGKRATWRR